MHDIRIEGAAADDRFMDGQVFDPHRIADYVGGVYRQKRMRGGIGASKKSERQPSCTAQNFAHKLVTAKQSPKFFAINHP